MWNTWVQAIRILVLMQSMRRIGPCIPYTVAQPRKKVAICRASVVKRCTFGTKLLVLWGGRPRLESYKCALVFRQAGPQVL